MADYVDNLTDGELRVKMAEFGFPTVPITATTRKVMQKKLKMFIENQNKISAAKRRSLSKFSSGEESDDNDVKVQRNRRVTMAVGAGASGAMLPPSAAPKAKKVETKVKVSNGSSEAKGNGAENSTGDVIETTTTTTTRRFTKTSSLANEDNDYSDSDVEIIESKTVNKTQSPPKRRQSPRPQPPDFSSDSRSKTRKETIEDDTDEPPVRSPYFAPRTSPKSSTADYASSIGTFSRASNIRSPESYKSTISSPARDSGLSPSRSGSAALDNLNQIRSRLSLGTSLPSVAERTSAYSSTYDRRNSSLFGNNISPIASPSSAATSSVDTKVETPYFSEFTRRLSQISGTRKRDVGDFDAKNDIIKENDVNGSQFSKGFLSRYPDRSVDISREFKKSQEKNIFKNNVVSFTLVGIVSVFFLALSFLYMGMRTDHVPLLDIETDSLPYCETSKEPDLLRKPTVNCIKKDSVDAALALLKIIQPELQRRAANSKCTDHTKAPHMLDKSIVEYTHNLRSDIDIESIREHLYNLQLILVYKPALGVSLIEIKNIFDSKFDEPVITDPEILNHRHTKNLALVVKNPDVPLSCLLFTRFYTISWYVAIVLGVGLILLAIRFAVNFFLRLNREKSQKIYEMVEQIIDILSRHAINSENGENFMAVSHIRDMLIPVQDRQKMNSIWNAAVQFLENNESRVRSEVQIVAGDEYRVWRWLGNSALNLSGTRGKVWQGQAFDTSQEGSVNSLPISPTQCLKIRQMVDKNDTTGTAHQVITDAILEKCGENCKILHIGIDSATCCVYVKCASQQDAGVAYRNLHGWWYDGKLITVKYIRLERYLDRFPKSSNSGYLKPSNNKKLSLQTDWSSNNDENE